MIDRVTFENFWVLAKKSHINSGLMIIDGYDYWEKFLHEFDPWFKYLCPEVVNYLFKFVFNNYKFLNSKF